VLSYHSAAPHYGLHANWLRHSFQHLTVRWPADPVAPPGVLLHRTRHLRVADVRRLDGVAVTSPARTLVDLCTPAVQLTNDQLVDVADSLISAKHLSVAVLSVYLRDLPEVPGAGRARQLLAEVCGERVESAAERHLLRLLAAQHLPKPHSQFELFDSSGHLVARVDAAWPRHRIALELDGYRYHSGTQAFRLDRERGNRVQAEGWRLYRTTPAEVSDGAAELIALLRAELSRDR
jgi:very-short-patch-repair endonuclease